MNGPQRLAKAVAWALPASIGYLVLVPWAGLAVDRRLGVAALPGWCAWPGVSLFAIGAIVALWTVWLFAMVGRGTPNPMAPPRRLVTQGPYRYSRNPMMLGGWVAGFGLALVLRSPSLLVAIALIAAVGATYVRRLEEPRLRQRFGPDYDRYRLRTARWLGCPRV